MIAPLLAESDAESAAHRANTRAQRLTTAMDILACNLAREGHGDIAARLRAQVHEALREPVR